MGSCAVLSENLRGYAIQKIKNPDTASETGYVLYSQIIIPSDLFDKG